MKKTKGEYQRSAYQGQPEVCRGAVGLWYSADLSGVSLILLGFDTQGVMDLCGIAIVIIALVSWVLTTYLAVYIPYLINNLSPLYR